MSTFAGNPYFIDLETLIDKKLLTKEECESCDWGGSESYVDYEKMYLSRFKLLRKAYERANLKNDPDYVAFLKQEEDWLLDYCLFMAIKNAQNGNADRLAGRIKGPPFKSRKRSRERTGRRS